MDLKQLTFFDYVEIIKALPPKALEELIRRYKEGKIKNEKTLLALSSTGIIS